ncbi:LacI family DNA-binding transcriptional regulator [Petrotoga sp. 9PWA.NaAc.5.4]|uniref:LacI family DNA-binding transcriptional regulator n=1 Tax=Petrotoga sp. 9PWA.NaAc.5.4 TaxID=1434328 RepID=UPI000CAC7ACD|nr:LacI family DNA-binding transcriptional regulator [Petrotoga sp. 9PWA.NaAc.5.4]PNR96982.1 LacI family transcriptional regulator [Petrotoga sp. 9PWA.NaAc.5.4]
MPDKVTIKEIAKEAGVSISTVSRVMNGSLPVKKETKEKVLKAVKKLNYYPDSLARSLRIGYTKTIGIIIPNIANPFFATIVRGAEDYLRSKGFSAIICNSDNDVKEEERLLKLLTEKKVDGILYSGIGDHAEELINRNVHIVFIDRVIKENNFSYVCSNNYQGMQNLLEYLYKTNHKKYTFISGKKEIFSATERLRAFLDFVEKYNLDYQIYEAEYTYESGLSVAKKIKVLPDVIVCSNDLIAYGVIEYLKSKNINVPKDVGVTGYDDITFSKMFSPALTTVSQPIYEMGKTAAEIIYKIILKKEDSFALPVKLFPNKVIVRNSTRRSEAYEKAGNI